MSKGSDTSPGIRTRRWSLSRKKAIVMESFAQGASVSVVARKHNVAPSQLYAWRKQLEEGAEMGIQAKGRVVSYSEHNELQKRVRRLSQLLGEKTEEVEILKEAVRVAGKKKWISHKKLQAVGGLL